MSWIELLSNPTPIVAVMKLVPRLEYVRLHEIILHQDGPDVLLRLDLLEYPEDPPKKWVAGQYDTAQLSLRLGRVTEIRLSGWSLDNIVDLEIVRITSGISIKVTHSLLDFECVCQFLSVDKISGYCKGEH